MPSPYFTEPQPQAQQWQSRTAQARQDADRAGAETVVSTLYRTGVLRERDALSALRAGRHGEAENHFSDATRIFDEARTQADRKAVQERKGAQEPKGPERKGVQEQEDPGAERRASDASAGMMSARRAAERAGAEDYARDDFRRAVALASRAEEVFRRRSFVDACGKFDAAREAFEEAVAGMKRKIAATRTEVSGARAAVRTKSGLADEGRRSEEEATKEERAGNLGAAIEALDGALQAYTRAHQIQRFEGRKRLRMRVLGAAAGVALLTGVVVLVLRLLQVGPWELAHLKFEKVTPGTHEVTIAEDAAQTFSVVLPPDRAGDAKLLWRFDGSDRGNATTFTYHASFDDAPGPHRVTVAATAGREHVEQAWEVKVTDVNRPPVISGAEPERERVTLVPGTPERFRVEVTDPDRDDDLEVAWNRNGSQIGTGPEIEPRELTDGDTIVASVKDRAGATATRRWHIGADVPTGPDTGKPSNTPPELTDIRPSRWQPVHISEDDEMTFSVRATDREGGALAWSWWLDSKPMGYGPTLVVRGGEIAPGKAHRLEVEVVDPGGLHSQRGGWNIVEDLPPEEQARRVIEPPSTIEVRPPTTTLPPPFSEEDARRWLKQYEEAYEQRKAARLVDLGVIPASQQADT